jgi:asparagine synthase (glutamine-hydrolysing)
MASLAVLDLLPAAHQPMSTQYGKIRIVHNDEVLNFQEERQLLEAKGFCFQSIFAEEVGLANVYLLRRWFYQSLARHVCLCDI